MNEINIKDLSEHAWECRENAYLFGNTKVGVALISKTGNIYTGCNIEHRYRCHDIHAETNAISNMISHGDTKIAAILIAAERDFFSPCGSCLDWIFQFSDEETIIGIQNKRGGEIISFSPQQLMPFYPK